MSNSNDNRPTVTVFGSGSVEEGSEGYAQASRLGAALAAEGLAHCSGGYGGTMLAGARAAREGGAPTLGVTLRGDRCSAPNRFLQTVLPCESLAERIMTLLVRGDGYAVLPGGTGTLAELAMMLELMNKRLLALKPAVCVGPYWQPVLEMMAGESILSGEAPWEAPAGVRLMGKVACAESPEAAARFLAVNLRRR